MSEETETQWAVCACQHCSNRIEFEGSNVGETIKCPHCGEETGLTLAEAGDSQASVGPEPQPEPLSAAPAAPPAPKIATLVEDTICAETGAESDLQLTMVPEKRQPSGVDDQLEMVGSIYFGLSCLAGVILFFAGLIANQSQPDWFLIVGGIAAAAQGFVIFILFKAAAEVIRLLRQSATYKVTGIAAQLQLRRQYKCSACLSPARLEQTECSTCGATFNRWSIGVRDHERLMPKHLSRA